MTAMVRMLILAFITSYIILPRARSPPKAGPEALLPSMLLALEYVFPSTLLLIKAKHPSYSYVVYIEGTF